MSGLPNYVMCPIHAASLPTSPAGRLEFAHDLLNGFPIVDEDGNDTGERTAPAITVEQFREIVER